MSDGAPVAQLSLAVTKFIEFVTGHGKALCAQNGFPPVRFCIGIAGGPEKLLVDSFHVSVSGKKVIDARRIASAAAPGQILLTPDLAAALIGGGQNFRSSESFSIQSKKDLIQVTSVILLEATASKSAA